MDDYIKFNNQTSGRDKLFRLLQYTSRVLWYHLQKRDSKPLCVEKAKRLDESLGLMRRLLRFGRFFETLHSALPVMSTVSDHLIRITSALSRISSAFFMLIDHIVCLDKLGLLPAKMIDAAKWDRTSVKFWLYSILLGLIRDMYEIMRIYKEEYQFRSRSRKYSNRQSGSASYETKPKNPKDKYISGNAAVVKCIQTTKVVSKCVTDHADIAVDSLKNFCDLFIPLNALGFVKLSPGTIGLLGIISTIASAVPQINPMVKMVPAT